MRIFGLQITKAENTNEQTRSFVAPSNEDGAIEIAAAVGGMYGTYFDLTGQAKNEAELITKYRSMARDSVVKRAIDDVVNEAIVITDREQPVKLELTDAKLSASLKKRLVEEFDLALKILDFSNKGYEIFERWYIDGRLRYHAILDEKRPEDGIKELRYIDPRKIRKVREITKKKFGDGVEGTEVEVKEEYYIYSDKGFATTQVPGKPMEMDVKGIRIAKDSIIDVNSGLYSEDMSLVLSHLDSAVKPLNQLQALENAAVIYKLARAPERRIFYIDVGDLPKAKAEQYVHDMMTKHKNKLVYDATTGEIRDDRRFMTMLEDYWLPRREGGRGTQIDTLPGAQNVDDVSNVEYFQEKLYESLNVPSSRLKTDSAFNLGKSSEITRDEIKFAKFITRLRLRFSILFDEILERQVVLKKIFTLDEWQEIKNSIRYIFIEDNHYQELKRLEILGNRLEALRAAQDYVGIYYSKEWIRKNVLFLVDEEIIEIEKQLEKEKLDEPPEADGDANDDGFQDRHSKGLVNGEYIPQIKLNYVK